MTNHTARDDLETAWARYLTQRNHEVRRVPTLPHVLSSRNGCDRSYRWFLLHAEGRSMRLTAIDHENVSRQINLARKAGQEAYVVVKFDRPEPKVVVIPAEKAAKMGRISSKTGGIPWD